MGGKGGQGGCLALAIMAGGGKGWGTSLGRNGRLCLYKGEWDEILLSTYKKAFPKRNVK